MRQSLGIPEIGSMSKGLQVYNSFTNLSWKDWAHICFQVSLEMTISIWHPQDVNAETEL